MKALKKAIIIFIIAIILIIYLSAFKVNENECVIITQFGKPVRTINEAGLYFKLPGFLQNINRFDKRINVFKTQVIQLLLGDKNPIIITCYVCWKIHKPLTFFESLSNSENAIQKLGDMINSQLGNILGDYTIDNIINTEPEQVKLKEIEEKMLENANIKIKREYGIEVVKVGICRLEYPTIVSDAVYERMKSERAKEANKYRAEGKEEAEKIKAETDKMVSEILAEAYKQSQIIKGEGDKESIRIYADAYNKNVEFFEFIKSLEAYKEILKDKSTLILSTDSDLFKYLNMKEK